MEKKQVLIAFEASQEVMCAFRRLGFEAYSCDVVDCYGAYPEFHLKCDARDAILLKKWDLIIMHPPCTYTSLSGNRWYHKSKLRVQSGFFIREVWELACSVCNHVVLEQPLSVTQQYIGKKTQSIQPWQFGHGEVKETWLWLKNLPLLVPTDIVDGRVSRVLNMAPGVNRKKDRAKTYKGVAEAMAAQWCVVI